MSSYACDRCLVKFTNKTAYDRHRARKKPCEPVAEVVEAAQVEAMQVATKPGGELRREMYQARNILRRVGITGLEASDCITAVLILRELEAIYGKIIADIANYGSAPQIGGIAFKKTIAGKEMLLSTLKNLPFEHGKGKNFAALVRDAFTALAECKGEVGKWMKNVNFSGRIITLNDSRVAYDLIQYCTDSDDEKTRVARLKFRSKSNCDNFGHCYSTVIRDMMEGKDMGQFFTDLRIVDYAVRAVGRNRDIGTLLDPTCGSGGFLAFTRGADEYVGYEIDPRVATLASANFLFEHGALPTIHVLDFLRNAPSTQYDTVLANPPFGVKGLKHKDLVEDTNLEGDGAESFPVSSSATGFFLQRIIRVLKVGGRAAVVLPLGKELSGRAATEVKLRRLLLKACNILEIVSIPSGMFENTTIRTVLIVFDKVRELSECVKRKGKTRITIEIDDDIPNATDEVTFSEMLEDGKVISPKETKSLVSMTEIEEKAFSLSPDDHREEPETNGTELSSDIVLVKLGELFTIQKGKIPAGKTISGKFPFISIATNKTHNVSTDDGEILTISVASDNGTHMYAKIQYHQGPCAIGSLIGRLIPKEKDAIHLKYGYYILRYIHPQIVQRCEKGLANKTLDQIKFFELTIPLPPLEIQQRIARELDELAEGIELARKAAAHVERKMRYAMEDTLRAPDITRVKLGAICSVASGKSLTKKAAVDGLYPVYGGGDSSYTHNEFNRENKAVIAKDGVSVDCIRIVRDKFYLSHHAWTLTLMKEGLDTVFEPYLNHWLVHMQPEIYKLATGCAQKGISQAKFLDLEFQLPSLEIQQRLAKELDGLAVMRDVLNRDGAHTQALMHTHLTAQLSLPPTAADSVGENPEQTTDEKTDETSDEKEEADHTSEAGDADDVIDDLLG